MTKTGQHQLCLTALAFGAIFLSAVIRTPAAQAQTYSVVHRFTSADGASPYAGVIGDPAGGVAGTTYSGGASGYGAVFKVDKTGETLLYSFTGKKDGAYPGAGLVRDPAGNLYGTTQEGGASKVGVVFKLDTAGTVTVLHSFRGPDGEYPIAGLIRDPAGNFYGTTSTGGASFVGVVFKLDTTGKYTVLYSFTGGTDGAKPDAGLIRDSAGNLYGTTTAGGDSTGCNLNGCGVVYKLDTTGTETVLHSFTGGADGASPYAGLIRDSAGNLYGTTPYGGSAGACNTFLPGCGVVFKLDETGTETTLYSFTGGADGAYPNGGLMRDMAGNLYGTTVDGGHTIRTCTSGCGVVFQLDATGTETVLHTFTGEADGANPLGVLIQDAAGNLYGTASAGGNAEGYLGAGVLFRLQP